MGVFEGVKKAFDRFSNFIKPVTDKINLAVNTILLTIVYFIGVGLTSLTAKLVGKKFLKLEKEKTSSCWINKENKTAKYYENFRQF